MQRERCCVCWANKQNAYTSWKLGHFWSCNQQGRQERGPEHKAKLACGETLVDNEYTAFPTGSTGGNHSPHTSLPHKTFFFCLFFEAVVPNLCHHVSLSTVHYQESRKYFATHSETQTVCVFLKYCGYFYSNIVLLCYINQLLFLEKTKM